MPHISPFSTASVAPAVYPDPKLSERRSTILEDFTRTMQDGAGDPNEACETFLTNFTSMGLFDQTRDCLMTGSEKSRGLQARAVVHIGSFPAGRAFLRLQNDPELRSLNRAAHYLLSDATPEARSEMLAESTLEGDAQIVLKLPTSGVRVPLTASCIGSASGGFTVDELTTLLLERDTYNRTLLKRVASPDVEPPESANDVYANFWLRLLAYVAGSEGFNMAASNEDFSDVGVLYQKVRHCVTRSWEIGHALRGSAKAFQLADIPKRAAPGWLAVGEFHEKSLAESSSPLPWSESRRILLSQASAFTQAAEQYMQFNDTPDAITCADGAIRGIEVLALNAEHRLVLRLGERLHPSLLKLGQFASAQNVAATVLPSAKAIGLPGTITKWEERTTAAHNASAI